MKKLKKIINYLFDKDVWIGTMISSFFLIIFLFSAGYIAFFTSIHGLYKIIIIFILAAVLYLFCTIVDRFVFKKMGREPP